MKLLAISLCGLLSQCAPAFAGWENSGYSRSYGSPADWKRHLNASNAVWFLNPSNSMWLKSVPAWTHFERNTAYTHRRGLETLDHYLTGK